MKTQTATVSFEDVHEYDGSTYYFVPNENVSTWSTLLEKEGVNVHKAAGICSGGEVGFLAMLPHVQRELVLIDHSYRSLSIAMTKHLLFQNLGAEEALKVLTSKDPNAVVKAFKKFRDNLPEKLQTAFDRVVNQSDRYSSGDWGYNKTRTCATLAAMWSTPKAANSVRKLGKIKYVHGDLSDLEKFGPFGLIYLSNALDYGHRSRSGQPALADVVSKAARKGTYIIECCAKLKSPKDPDYYRKSPPKEWKLIEESTSKIDNYAYGWRPRLWQVQ